MEETRNTNLPAREIWIDWLRVAACFMVMVVHSTEPFYLGGDGSLILTRADAFWSAVTDSLVRSCVPLFVIASSYLQFPLRYRTREFFSRRVKRVLLPLLVWSFVYAFAYGNPVQNFRDLLLNFNYAAGHLWFVYMLFGVYLVMPLLSPWAEKVGKKELLAYLGIWLFTTLIPLFRSWATGDASPLVHGPSGIPMPALYPVWGEASWNVYGTFYYVSGFLGYLLLGLYFRRFAVEYSWKKALALSVPSFLAGFAIAAGGFYRRVMHSSGGLFPSGGDVSLAVGWETTWGYDTIGVVLMAVGIIIFARKIQSSGKFYSSVVRPVSDASYGMYLSHMLVLPLFSGLLRGWLGFGEGGVLGFWTTPVEILLTAAVTFVTTAVIAVRLRRIPGAGKILMG